MGGGDATSTGISDGAKHTDNQTKSMALAVVSYQIELVVLPYPEIGELLHDH